MSVHAGGRFPAVSNALDPVGVRRSLREKSVTAVLARLVLSIFDKKFFSRMLKHGNELVPDDFSLLLRIGHAFERGQKTLARIDVFQTNMKIFAEYPLNNFFFTRAEQPV